MKLMQALNDQMHETTIGRRYLVVAFMRPILTLIVSLTLIGDWN